MDFDFSVPTLEARKRLYSVHRGKEEAEALLVFLQEHGMSHLIRDYIQKGYISPAHDNAMETEPDLELMNEDELKELADKLSAEVSYERFLQTTQRLFTKNRSLALKFDAYTAETRMLMLLERLPEAEELVRKTESLLELGIDWGRKNKFKVYRGLFRMREKEYLKAAELFLDALSTFESEELLTYRELVHYTIFTGMLTLPRNEIGKRLIESSEVCEMIREIPSATELIQSFYECSYQEFFHHLAVFSEGLANDVNLKDSGDYFVYMMKVRTYNQLFMSYKAISVEQMSAIFRVSSGYVLKDIEGMILREDILCKINHQNMMIYNTPPESKGGLREQAEELSHTIQKLIK
ncbi:26S proteasome regulatory subunit N7 [Nematocida displodere]|uniref:26S proteasome regulatory subunit N7 n=1 Tax=Nematocida displodere TaxID=1805483 RepID=A0A177EB72_9MICR|nr:26S proteasome regulatory subunit N7 [Nematocida displodere]